MPPLVRPPLGTLLRNAQPGSGSGVHVPLFHRHAGRGAMGFEIRCINHNRPFLAMIDGQAYQHLGENAFVAPPLSTIV